MAWFHQHWACRPIPRVPDKELEVLLFVAVKGGRAYVACLRKGWMLVVLAYGWIECHCSSRRQVKLALGSDTAASVEEGIGKDADDSWLYLKEERGVCFREVGSVERACFYLLSEADESSVGTLK